MSQIVFDGWLFGCLHNFFSICFRFFLIIKDENYLMGFLYVFITVIGTILGFALGFYDYLDVS